MIAQGQLIACALGELDADADAAVETHVLTCGACAAQLATFVRLGPAIAALIRSDGIAMVATDAMVAMLDREQLISKRYLLAPGSTVPCSVGPDDIYSLSTLEAELAGATRVDLIRGGHRLVDVPFDPTARHVHVVTRGGLLRALPTAPLVFRLIAVDGDGHEREIAAYTLDHTAFAPSA